MTQQLHPWVYIKKKTKTLLHPNIHSSIIYNSQDMEATKYPSTDE